MVEILLTQGYTVRISNHRYELASPYSWFANKKEDGKVYAMARVGGKMTYLHTLIMKPPKGAKVDYIDGDTLNCEDENLRVCTNSQDLRNAKRRKDNLSNYKGVRKANSKWATRILGKHIGTFSTPEDAARAYDKKAKELFGEFARLNFPEKLCPPS